MHWSRVNILETIPSHWNIPIKLLMILGTFSVANAFIHFDENQGIDDVFWCVCVSEGARERGSEEGGREWVSG
jgi:hypothetical protein